MAIIKNNTPKFMTAGFRDDSIVQLAPELLSSGIHMPLFYVISERGSEKPFNAKGGDAIRILGDKTFDVRSKYYNHVTAMMERVMGAGNPCWVKRIIPADAATSGLTLTATVDTATGINEFERDVDGSVVLDVNGAVTYQNPAVPIAGGVLLKLEWVDTETFVTGGVFDPSPTGPVDGKIYPILSIEAPDPGEWGNSYGIRLFVPREGTTYEPDLEVVADQNAFMLNAQLVRKTDAGTSVLLEDLYSSKTQEFMLKENAFNYKTNVDLKVESLVDNYSDDGKLTGASPTAGPLGKVTLHRANLEEVLTALVAAEDSASPDTWTADDRYMLDILTGKDVDGVHHYGFQIDGTGSTMSSGVTHYMVGGSDGTIDGELDNLVESEIDNNYQNSSYPLVDSAQYPFSAIIDSGFGISTKKKLMKWLGYRPNVHVLIGTHVVGEDTLTVSEEISVGSDLLSTAGVYIESEENGTPSTRVVLMMQSGTIGGYKYRERVPMTFDLARKRALYAGGVRMKTGLGYDTFPNNVVSDMIDVSNTWLSSIAKEKVWSAGLNFCQYADANTIFYPAYQTVYPIKGSVLNSDIVMMIGANLTLQAEKVWTMISGDSKLTPAQIVEKSNRLLSGLVEGLYDDRVVITPNTVFTPADAARGYSYTLNITVEANVMRTVQSTNVIFKRFGN